MEKIMIMIVVSLASVVMVIAFVAVIKFTFEDSEWYKKTKKYRIEELENRLGAVTACCNRTEVRMEKADEDNETRIHNVQRDLGSLVEFLNIEAEYRDGWIYKNKKVEGLK